MGQKSGAEFAFQRMISHLPDKNAPGNNPHFQFSIKQAQMQEMEQLDLTASSYAANRPTAKFKIAKAQTWTKTNLGAEILFYLQCVELIQAT